jgi:chromosome segregation ATPase
MTGRLKAALQSASADDKALLKLETELDKLLNAKEADINAFGKSEDKIVELLSNLHSVQGELSTQQAIDGLATENITALFQMHVDVESNLEEQTSQLSNMLMQQQDATNHLVEKLKHMNDLCGEVMKERSSGSPGAKALWRSTSKKALEKVRK